MAAAPPDLVDVAALVAAGGLTLAGLDACVAGGTAVLCREHDGCLLGVAVHAPVRGHGLGRALVERALDDARRAGAREAWLLTESAEAFFAGLGWAPADRAAAPPAIAASVEFASACPTSAIAMRRTL